MNIVIAGAGEVGFHLSNMLSKEAQNIIVVDLDEEKLQGITNHMDVMTVEGSAISIESLEEAQIKDADLFIAVTSSEEINISACIFAKSLGAKRTICRIANHEYLDCKKKVNFENLGIDHLIYPEEIAAEEIHRLILNPQMSESHDFSGGKMSLVGIVLEENAPTINKSLIEVVAENPNFNCNAVAIHRADETLIPRGNTVFLPGDHVYFICPPSEIERLMELSGKNDFEVKNVMILGGSKMGYHTASFLENTHKVKLIEKDKNKAFNFADKLKNTLVLHGDCNDSRFLEDEGIKDMDAFIAVTGNAETNIIACLMAKKYGVQKTIAGVNNIEYLDLSQNLGIDTLINKKFIAASKILKFIRKGDIMDITSLPSADAEVLEFKAKTGSKITKKKVMDLGFPSTAIIGGIIRKQESVVASGNMQIEAGDEVIVFALPEAISKVEKFFK